MSGHERERLSAYLDGELASDERRAVEAHLEACPECRARLADLGALDEAARALPAEAPAGYFDAFAARVRTRIEAEGPRRARAGGSLRRLPVWTWAAAAALLLAVVTPLTLRRVPREGTGPAPATRPVQAESHVARETAPLGESEDRLGARVVPAPAVSPPPPPLQNESDRDEEAAGARATPPRPKGEGQASLAGAPPPGEVPAAQKTSAGDFAAAPPPAPSAVAVGQGAPEPSAAAPMAEAQAAGPPPESRSRRPGPAGLEKAAVLPSDEVAYVRLARAQPADGAGWREIREAWRAFAEEHPDSRHADEARVRVIEAGVAAWRAGGDEDDLARARADLAAYLGRSDGRLEERARRALEAAPGP